MNIKFVAAAAAVAFSFVSTDALARDQIKTVGSSTVYPFATTVAEYFGKNTEYKTPVIESTGTGGGMKLFCAGTGLKHPDITNASRPIKKSEKEKLKNVKDPKRNISRNKVGQSMQMLKRMTPEQKYARKMRIEKQKKDKK